ncbi:J domain-containing protein [Cyanobacterium aponinum]|uniref:J domain-containing protein n=1 Tax=Cyanobacterium aponinum 0216 TaxID=2676140 RepID=A0A844H0Q9_9CHRO|nr:J domain-containing protein [Cyanobacterium aponinum]MTF40629.1 J domain-containing protein [Cyanobacterium aponinum 0216]
MDNLSIEQCYKILNIDNDLTLAEIDKHYYSLVAEKLKSGEKEELVSIRQAYLQLTEYKQKEQKNKEKTQTKQFDIYLTKTLNKELLYLGVRIKVESYPDHILLKFRNLTKIKKSQIVKLVYDYLTKLIKEETKIVLINFGHKNQIIWQTEFKILPNISPDKLANYNQDIFLAEAEIKTNTYALPIGFFIAFAINFIDPLVWFISVWIHELGHATLAWFSGYRAMVTFAATIVSFEHSLFVYFGILFLLLLTIYSTWKENKKYIIIFLVFLIFLQFILTWTISRSTYGMLLAFAGIGGEFYLSTLFIISFYWNLPQRFYWEFWRYIFLIWGMITFWGSWTRWQKIKVGKSQIPWGTFWSGRGDSGGDLNILRNQHDWGIERIINTYNTLGFICFLVILFVYFYNLWISNPNLRLRVNKMFSKF